MKAKAQTGRGAVLLTGASGGIGSITARRLDTLGFRVFAGVRKIEDGIKLQQEISSNITPILLDVTDADSINMAVETIAQTPGNAGLVGLINNAGLIIEGPVELVPMAEVRKQFEVNTIGQIAVTQAFLPLIREGHGRIINIGAASGKVTFPYLGILSASKAALDSITNALRGELRPWGISVSIIEPMGMQTKIFEKSATAAQEARQQLPDKQQKLYAPALAAISKALSQQHVDAPDLVVNAIVHALTAHKPKARYAVGQGSGMISLLRLLPDRIRDNLILNTFGLSKIQPGI